jgi:putative peptide zinc metalloprotease protein
LNAQSAIQNPKSAILNMPKPIASIDRPLALRLRPDLIAMPVEMSKTRTWIINDPATLEHFQFSAEEFALLDWLRQPVSIAELRRRFANEFSPQTISSHSVWDFLARLHSAGLLIADDSGQGNELLARMRRDRVRRWALSWTGLLSIRFRGLDPDRFLTAVHDRLGWLFSPLSLVTAVVAMVFAASIVFGHFDEFRTRLPEVSALFDARNLLWLLLSIGAVKLLHELGHALACKHFGGKVHELGLMLLVFAPCLYCDVSDAWRLTSKWQRIAVSAAGMMVEIVLAAVATIVWWYAQPGVLQLIAMNIMVVCTVGTLLVNGNPLLRYDGYYILSDLVETPNLWQRSREALRRFTTEWLLGQPAADDPLVPASGRSLLAAYAVASKCYVALVCAAIIWSLVVLLYPLHLQNLAYAVGLTVVGSAVIGPVSGIFQLLRNPIRRAELRTGRLSLITTIGLGIAVAVLALPVTYHVHAPLVLMPEDAARVYATIDGALASAPRAGSHVKRGDVIGRLENLEVDRELERVAGECRLKQLRLEHLEKLRGADPEAGKQIPTAWAALADSEHRLEDRRRDAERLTLKAPADGFVLPAPRTPAVRHWASTGGRSSDTRLATWSGSLLDPTNLGATLEPSTLVCLVGDPSNLTAVLLVGDTDVKRLQPGQSVRLRLEQSPGCVMEGEVVDVARHEVQDHGGDAAVQTDLATLYAGLLPPGRRATYYQARIRFDPPQQPLVIGGRGHAKVAAERITLARFILRFVGQTFRIPI